MDTTTYEYQDTLLVLDDTVVEVFRRLVAGSQRMPLAWAGASLKPKKDEIQVQVGLTSSASDPFYTDSVVGSGAFTFSIPQSEEANLRSFLDETARRGQRR